MNETYVTIRGRLTADPTVRTTRTGRADDDVPHRALGAAAGARAAGAVGGHRGELLRRRRPTGRSPPTSRCRCAGATRSPCTASSASCRGSATTARPGTASRSRRMPWATTSRSAPPRSPGSAWGDPPSRGAGRRPGRRTRGRAGRPGGSGRLGDPERDPYVVDGGPGRGLGEVERPTWAAGRGAGRRRLPDRAGRRHRAAGAAGQGGRGLTARAERARRSRGPRSAGRGGRVRIRAGAVLVDSLAPCPSSSTSCRVPARRTATRSSSTTSPCPSCPAPRSASSARTAPGSPRS